MGNKLGWVLAGVAVLGVTALVLVVVVFPPASAPTGATLRGGSLDLHLVGVSAAKVIGAVPAGKGNAGDDYRKAIDAHRKHAKLIAEAIGKFGETPRVHPTLPPPALEALEQIASHVAAGAARKEMRFTFVHTPATFEYGYFYRPTEDLERVAEPLSLLVYHYRAAKRYADAEKVLRDRFVMGWHMMNERSRTDLVTRGIAIQEQTISSLKTLYRERPGGHAAKIADLAEYATALREVREHYFRKHLIFASANSIEPGDVFNIAVNDKDRAFRVQAILALGRLRFVATRRGDVRRTKKLIERFLESDDPLERAAAVAARDLTPEEYRLSGMK